MKPSKRHNQGFSLIEIMVGMLIGMLSVIIMMQIFSSSEASKRTTTGGNDAQVNGTLALYELERTVRQSGHGISSFSILGCSLTYTTTSDAVSVTLPALAPATVNPSTNIVPAGDANTDTLLVIAGSSGSPSEGDATLVITTATSYQVTTPTSFRVNDYVVAAPATRATPCALTMRRVTNIAASALTVASGTAGLPVGSYVFNLGTPLIRAYAIRNGSLTVCDYTAFNCGNAAFTGDTTRWVPVAGNIMGMRAQYAKDTSGITGSSSVMTGVVDTFDQTTPGGTGDTTTIPDFCKWSRVIGVRVALVARSQQYDKGISTAAAPTWAGAVVNTATSATMDTVNPTAVTFDLTGDTDWQHYRYKTLQTTVPLRNMIWQGSQSTYQGGSGGC